MDWFYLHAYFQTGKLRPRKEECIAQALPLNEIAGGLRSLQSVVEADWGENIT